MDAYTRLGLTPDASMEQIKAAFRRQAQALHPDKHATADRSVQLAATASFCALREAYQAALEASRRGAVTTAVPTLPRQRVAESAAATTIGQDPVVALLTLPHHLDGWSRDELVFWALTLAPAARRHRADAKRLAEGAGALDGNDHCLATAHILLTLTLTELGGTRRIKREHFDAAYGALEARLPAMVRRLLPGRYVF